MKLRKLGIITLLYYLNLIRLLQQTFVIAEDTYMPPKHLLLRSLF